MSDTTAESIDALRASHERQYDPFNPVPFAEHFADIADRRENCPLTFSPDGGFWLATTYDDISSVLRRNNRGFESFPNVPDGSQPFGQKRQIPIELDGPIHRAYRKILDPLFSPTKVAEMEATVRTLANSLIDAFIASGRCDVVPQFAFPLPGSVFLGVMGWPLEDAEKMNAWVDTFLHGVPGASQDEVNAARMDASEKSRAYIQEIVDDRRANPRDDITSTVVHSQIDGEPISDGDLSDLFILMMMAGLDTVQSVISQSVAYLAGHQDQWEEMFATPEALGPALEELLRWTSPAFPTRNVVAESVTVGELEFPKGERVHCPLVAANRDPKYFPDPDAVDFHRDRKPHLTFSLGAHRCIGLHLARLELRVAFQELHRRIPSFSLAPGCEPTERVGLTLAIENVEIAFPPGQPEGA